jgi:hypothetical protein
MMPDGAARSPQPLMSAIAFFFELVFVVQDRLNVVSGLPQERFG